MRQAKKERKEFQNPIPLKRDPEEKILKKNSKKIQKIKKELSVVIYSQNRMRYDEIGREREKRIYTRIPLTFDPGEKIPKKNSKKI